MKSKTLSTIEKDFLNAKILIKKMTIKRLEEDIIAIEKSLSEVKNGI